jgi:hypothetical protein
MKKLFFLFLLISIPFLSEAHGYWLEVEGSGKIAQLAKILIYFGEFENQKRETGSLLDKMAEIKIYVIDTDGNKKEISMSQTDTHWEGIFTPTKEGLYQILGINDTREVQDWRKHSLGIVRPVQYLRTTYSVGNSTNNQKSEAELDALVTQSGDNIMVTAWKNKEAFAKAKIRVINPEGWAKDKVTNDNGKTQLKSNRKGLYLIELEYIDKNPGNFKGKDYETVRYRCETTVKIN